MLHKRLVFSAELIHGTFKNMGVKCPGVAPGYANAQPPGRDKIANVPPPGTDNASKCPAVARGGGWAPLKLTDALLVTENMNNFRTRLRNSDHPARTVEKHLIS